MHCFTFRSVQHEKVRLSCSGTRFNRLITFVCMSTIWRETGLYFHSYNQLIYSTKHVKKCNVYLLCPHPIVITSSIPRPSSDSRPACERRRSPHVFRVIPRLGECGQKQGESSEKKVTFYLLQPRSKNK